MNESAKKPYGLAVPVGPASKINNPAFRNMYKANYKKKTIGVGIPAIQTTIVVKGLLAIEFGMKL